MLELTKNKMHDTRTEVTETESFFLKIFIIKWMNNINNLPRISSIFSKKYLEQWKSFHDVQRKIPSIRGFNPNLKKIMFSNITTYKIRGNIMLYGPLWINIFLPLPSQLVISCITLKFSDRKKKGTILTCFLCPKLNIPD